MNAPVTTLDQRYSDPEAEVVSAWTDGALYFTTGVGEQKYVNLQANPNVVLMTGSSDWDHGIGVVVEGKAVHVTDEAVLGRVAQAFAVRWDGRWEFEARDGRFYNGGPDWPCEVFGVAPARAFAHAKGDPFGATTHRF